MTSGSTKFEEPRCMSSSFAVNFPRRLKILSYSERFSEALGPRFGPPATYEIPDTVDPTVARLVFRSIHGFSHIIVTQSAVALNINYSPDWQIETGRRSEHLQETVGTLFRAVAVIGDPEIFFCGLMTQTDIETRMSDSDLVRFLEKRYVSREAAHNVFDAMVRLTDVERDRYFVNMTFENYRNWHGAITNNPTVFVPLPHKTAQSRGIRVTTDVNDRFGFNEKRSYRSNIDAAIEIIDLSEKRLSAAISAIMEV